MKKNSIFLYTLLCFLFAIVLIPSCQKDAEKFSLEYKYEYFPLDSGRYWIYRVDSITFNNNTTPTTRDTAVFYVRERVESIYPDNANRPTARIERSRRNDTIGNWSIIDIWFANRTQTTGEKSEENLRFVKLLFPPREGQTWKGNQYIQVTESIKWLNNWDYVAQTLDVPATTGGISFDSTLTVLQRDDENLIEKSFSSETYAKNVGLVYKELLHLTKEDVTAPWTEPRSGFILKMTIVDYGN
jgi:hypothetical protein